MVNKLSFRFPIGTFWIKNKNIYLLGAQLSSRFLWTDGSISKCRSILTYPKRHEPSLDIWETNRFDTLVILFWRHILLVVWKCLILCQIIVICGKCWFFLSFKENGGWSASRAPKSLQRCSSKWNNVPWLVPSLQRRWFRCWRPSAWKESRKPSKMLMLFIMSCWNRTKPSLGNGI